MLAWNRGAMRAVPFRALHRRKHRSADTVSMIAAAMLQLCPIPGARQRLAARGLPAIEWLLWNQRTGTGNGRRESLRLPCSLQGISTRRRRNLHALCRVDWSARREPPRRDVS